jgi:hypothetical protein
MVDEQTSPKKTGLYGNLLKHLNTLVSPGNEKKEEADSVEDLKSNIPDFNELKETNSKNDANENQDLDLHGIDMDDIPIPHEEEHKDLSKEVLIEDHHLDPKLKVDSNSHLIDEKVLISEKEIHKRTENLEKSINHIDKKIMDINEKINKLFDSINKD